MGPRYEVGAGSVSVRRGKARTRYEALGLSVLEEAGPRPGRKYESFIVQGSVLGHRYEVLDP